MERAVGFGDRHAQKGERDQQVAANFIGDLERGREHIACNGFGRDQHDRRDQEQGTNRLAAILDQRRSGHDILDKMRRHAIGHRLAWCTHDYRPMAARTCFRAAIASGPWVLAHSSQYGEMSFVPASMSCGSSMVTVMPPSAHFLVRSSSSPCMALVIKGMLSAMILRTWP